MSGGAKRFAAWWRRWWSRRGGPEAKSEHLRAGEWGERRAEDFLRRLGWRTLGRRVRGGRHGEVDLVMRDPRGVVIFVEVKTRGTEDFGRPVSAVGRKKRETLSHAAIAILRGMRPPPDYFRFDVVEVIGREDDPAPPVIRHLENVFPLAGRLRPPLRG